MKKDISLKSARFYKVKNPTKSFLCALCTAPRQMKYSKNLSIKNYIQITLLCAALSWALFPVMGLKSIYLMFVVWPIVEVANKLLYRKEIPCPYCGFDATWYRRDVKVAKRKVEDFWNTNYPELTKQKEQMVQAVSQENPKHEAKVEEVSQEPVQ